MNGFLPWTACHYAHSKACVWHSGTVPHISTIPASTPLLPLVANSHCHLSQESKRNPIHWTYVSPVNFNKCSPIHSSVYLRGWAFFFFFKVRCFSLLLLFCFCVCANKGEFIQKNHSSTTLIEERKNHVVVSQWIGSWVPVLLVLLWEHGARCSLSSWCSNVFCKSVEGDAVLTRTP